MERAILDGLITTSSSVPRMPGSEPIKYSRLNPSPASSSSSSNRYGMGARVSGISRSKQTVSRSPALHREKPVSAAGGDRVRAGPSIKGKKGNSQEAPIKLDSDEEAEDEEDDQLRKKQLAARRRREEASRRTKDRPAGSAAAIGAALLREESRSSRDKSHKRRRIVSDDESDAADTPRSRAQPSTHKGKGKGGIHDDDSDDPLNLISPPRPAKLTSTPSARSVVHDPYQDMKFTKYTDGKKGETSKSSTGRAREREAMSLEVLESDDTSPCDPDLDAFLQGAGQALEQMRKVKAGRREAFKLNCLDEERVRDEGEALAKQWGAMESVPARAVEEEGGEGGDSDTLEGHADENDASFHAHRADLVEGKGEKVAEASESEEPESSEGRTACYFCSHYLPFPTPPGLWDEMVLVSFSGTHAPLPHRPNRYILDSALRRDFCAKHHHATQYAEVAAADGYPASGGVDWKKFVNRLESDEVRKAVNKICSFPAKSGIFRRISQECQEWGKVKWEEQYRRGAGVGRSHAGYYGDIGRTVIEHHLHNLLKWRLLPSLSKPEPPCAPFARDEFLTHVLMPEVAVSLIKQDLSLRLAKSSTRPKSSKEIRSEARRIWLSSSDYGQHVFPADGKEIEEVETWMVDLKVQSKIRARAIARREKDVAERKREREARSRERAVEEASSVGAESEMEEQGVVMTSQPSSGRQRSLPSLTTVRQRPERRTDEKKDGVIVVDSDEEVPMSQASLAKTASASRSRQREAARHFLPSSPSASASQRAATSRLSRQPLRPSQNPPPPSQDSLLGSQEDWMAQLSASQMDGAYAVARIMR